ncbi:BQ2448_6541 [Microbotryum intermedium]|uniref:BQ2448_6541 protein n=1 Tax=Microbotryum intermedium TaxID=269621 RepID=A0A238FMT4_9BASI|nr:BQ2448_6541 [Microbotryum intermedium]
MVPRPAPWVQGRKFGIVIDAGSSGSRVQVYSWIDPTIAKQQRKAQKKTLEVLSKVDKGVESGDGWHVKVEPGISAFGETPGQVGDYLKPLLEFAKTLVPASQLVSTPIYLLATAGMRLLPRNQQRAVLDSTCAYLQTYPFKVDDCDQQVRMITGEEEGLYGWVAVNYLMDGFDTHDHAAKLGHSHSSTYGFLDMGGASTQIAFEPAEKEQIAHRDNLLDVNLKLLSGRTVSHPVFVTTWLGYGTNQARNRYIDATIKSHIRVADKNDEPYPSQALDAEGLGSERPIVVVEDPCLPKNLLLRETRHSGYTLKGTGDFAACVRQTGPLLNKEVECLDQPCLFNGVHVPPIDFSVNHFIGISEYFYSTHDVWSLGGVYDYVEFEKNAIEYCARDWEDIMADHKSGKKWKQGVQLTRLETQCFKAAWVVNILHEGIGIPRIIDQGGEGDGKNLTDEVISKTIDKGLVSQPSFQSLNAVGDVAVSWTLGKMVLEVARGSTQAPTINPKRPYSLDWAKPRIPSWANGDVRSTLTGIKEDPFPLVGISFVLFALCFVVCSKSNIARKRVPFIGGILSSKRRNDFNPVPSDDPGFSSGDSASGGLSRSPPRESQSRRTKSNSFAQKTWFPFRYPLLRALSLVQSLFRSSRNGHGSLLPTSRSSNGNGNLHEMRPRPPRSNKPAPFMRAVTASNGTPQTQAGWNDVPERNNSTPVGSSSHALLAPLVRSGSGSFLSSRQMSSSPPPLTIVIPASPLATPAPETPPNGGFPTSRPTTPSSHRSGNGLSKLTVRSNTYVRERGTSDDFSTLVGNGVLTPSGISPSRNRYFAISDNPCGATSTPPSGSGLASTPLNQGVNSSTGPSTLANAVWESLGSGRMPSSSAEEVSGTSNYIGAGASSWNASVGGGMAKLRANKSQNGSQVNLSALASSSSAQGTGR